MRRTLLCYIEYILLLLKKFENYFVLNGQLFESLTLILAFVYYGQNLMYRNDYLEE